MGWPPALSEPLLAKWLEFLQDSAHYSLWCLKAHIEPLLAKWLEFLQDSTYLQWVNLPPSLYVAWMAHIELLLATWLEFLQDISARLTALGACVHMLSHYLPHHWHTVFEHIVLAGAIQHSIYVVNNHNSQLLSSMMTSLQQCRSSISHRQHSIHSGIKP